MHVWNATGNPLQVEVKSLKPNRFRAVLTHQVGNQSTVIPERTPRARDGTSIFDLNQQQAVDILMGTGLLLLETRHTLKPGAIDKRWGWRYRLVQGQQTLTAMLVPASGPSTPLPLDAHGYFNSALTSFGNATFASDVEAITRN
jgi:hypothetical protein